MGLTYAELEMINPFRKLSLIVKALVDTGAVFVSMPEHLAIQLGFDLTEVEQREVVLADGSHKLVPMIGPLRVRFANRSCDLSALVLGDEPLLGAVAMEMMDLVIHPSSQTLSVNPDSPHIPVALAK